MMPLALGEAPNFWFESGISQSTMMNESQRLLTVIHYEVNVHFRKQGDIWAVRVSSKDMQPCLVPTDEVKSRSANERTLSVSLHRHSS